MERVTGCFLRGHYLPALCRGWEEEGGGRRTNCGMLLLHLNVCQRNPSSVSFTASFHFVQNSITPSSPLSLLLSPLSEWHLIQLIWAFGHLTSLPVHEWVFCCTCTCACRSVCLIQVELSHLFIQMTLILVCLLALHLCVLTRHFRYPKKKRRWITTIEMIYCLWPQRLKELKAAHT